VNSAAWSTAASVACARFAKIEVPEEPKTTLNVGTFHGGTSVNAITEEATALIDMRSVEQGALSMLVDEALAIFEQTAAETGCTAHIDVVGDRPGGLIPQDHPLVQLAASVIREMGQEPKFSISSTDANIPLSQGVPAICIGAGNGGGGHTLREFLHIPSLVPGLQMLSRVLTGLDWSAIRG
jgi:tripeptide aminopeptidase